MTTVAAEIERTGKPPTKKIIQKFSDMGFLGVNLPQKYGGLGMSNFEAVLVLEEVAKISIALAFPVFESCFGPALAISYFASEKLKEKTLFKVCSGNMILAVAMSEPHAGSALTDLSTSATISNGRILVSGTKRWCSGASHADAYVVYCKMSNERGANGIGAVLIEKNRPGFSFGKKERHMGWRGVVSADMHFDNISLPLENIILPAGGFKKLMKAFDLERCGNTTMSLACAQSAFDYVLNYVQERKQFGKTAYRFPGRANFNC